jgi:hypothetical protein
LEFFLKCKFKTNAKTLETFAKILKSQNERKKKLITIMDAYQNKWLIMQLLCPLWQPATSVKFPKYGRPCWVFYKYLVPKMEGTRPINIALKI